MAENNNLMLRELVRQFERKLGMMSETQAACCQLTMAQCHALVEIGRREKISLNALAQIMGLDNSSMSRTVNNLVEKEMVDRQIDPSDRRFVVISLTDKGNDSFQGIETRMNEYFSQIYAALPQNKRAQVLESFQILIEAIN